LKVHLLSATARRGENFDQVKALFALWEASDKRHELVPHPQQADICLVCNIGGPQWFAELRRNKQISLHPGKCIAVHDGDVAYPLLHGIYTSVSRKSNRFGRFRGGAYNLFPRSTRNPAVENSPGRAYDASKLKDLSFWGQNSSSVRRRLLAMKWPTNIEVVDTTGRYTAFADLYDAKAVFQQKYFTALTGAKFALCPRGKSPSSMRLFESMQVGVAPVIVSDDLLLPGGPSWNEFSISVPESRIVDLPRIIAEHSASYREMGLKARVAFEQYFRDDVYFNYLVACALDIHTRQLLPEALFWGSRNLSVRIAELRQRL